MMEECVYVQRCVSVDEYLATPIPNLDIIKCPLSDLPIRKVPILRMFGATQVGQKACIHIHGVFPYLMVLRDDIIGDDDLSQIFNELEGAFNRSYGASKGQYIHNIEIYSGIPFYGFHEDEQMFLKIYFYKGKFVKRCAELLLQASLRGKMVQPYEAHFPYSLQFLTDFNIHGMNLVYFSKVMFRVSEEQYRTLTLNEDCNYLSQEIDITKIPHKHLVPSEYATKRCASSLELDALAVNILNVNFINVNCNPGLKAICEEERDRRHQAGNFTPSQKAATPSRNISKPCQTKQWEEKLQNIIKTSGSSLNQTSVISQGDNEIVDFLLNLGSPPTPVSQSVSTPSTLPQILTKLRKPQLDLSLHCENEEESDGDDDISVMMSQRVYYSDEQGIVDNNLETVADENATCNPSPGHPSDSDEYFNDDCITDSQILQLDGNFDTDTPLRKRKRLGARPCYNSTPISRVLRSSKCIGNQLFHNKDPSVDMTTPKKTKCTRANTQHTGQIATAKQETLQVAGASKQFIDLHSETKSTDSKPAVETCSTKSITKVCLSQRSPNADFDLSKFDDLKFSPSRSLTQNRKFKALDIVSPQSSKCLKSRISLSLIKKKKRTTLKDQEVSELSDDNMMTPLIESDLETTHRTNLKFKPKNLFSVDSKKCTQSPRTKLLKVLEKMDSEMSSIKSFPSASSGNDISDSSSDIVSESNVLEKKSLATEIDISQEIPKIEEKQSDLDKKVLLWLSESECSQDEDEDVLIKRSLPRNTPKSETDNHTEGSSENTKDISYSFSKDSFTYSPQSPTELSIAQEPSPTSNNDPQSAQSHNSLRPAELNVINENKAAEQSTSSMNNSTSLFSPNISQKSPIILSGSDIADCSLLSTPRLELDSSFFFSQFNADVLPIGSKAHSEPDIKSYKYTKLPPSLRGCKTFIRQNAFSAIQDSSILEPFCSSLDSIPEPSKVGDKQLTIKHINSLPNTIFFPESEQELDVLGLESWEEMIENKYVLSESDIVSMKYTVPPPSLVLTQIWLSQKESTKHPIPVLKKYNSVETKSLPNFNESVVCSTPLNQKVKFSSLPEKMVINAPITKTPVSMFQNKFIFSPNQSTRAPISPTLYMNSQISHLSNNDSFKFALTVPMGDSTKSHVVQHLTVMSIESFSGGIGSKMPNPRYDPVVAVFYAFYNDSTEGIIEGSICLIPEIKPKSSPDSTTFVETECEIFEEIFKVVHRYDPDLLTGYEIRNSSLGYLIERANTIGLNFQANISRFPDEVKEDDQNHNVLGAPSSWWITGSNEVQLAGRVIINLWRLMRTEVTLTNYCFESVAYHVLHERHPKLPTQTLMSLYLNPKHFYSFSEYFSIRTKGNLRLLLDLNIIVRTSEMGRLFGIEFFNVLSRGTQYRVESMMTRLYKPLNFVSISSNPEQRASMSAPEYIALVMEPESKFYGDPVVVLDFQSLYPSMIIAYNLCFSTCLGRVNYLGTHKHFPFGTSTLNIPPYLLKKYQNNIIVTPNGVAFVDKSVRHGILPLMLSEILETRIMVKQMMKEFKHDKALYRMLDARQMALKLIANVTYGYTSANFSGRMPCIEIGDAIVAKGRETLEAAIDLVHCTPKWGGRVVYGDTDSLFILFKGCTKAEAFERGKEIAEFVTNINPKPVKLKFEKVYQPCVLQTKKRYVGMKYETVDDPGEYEAKGIETVRRDGCPASVKTLKQALHILFNTRDISLVRNYVQNQFKKIIKSRIPLQDYIFAKEYRGKDTYRQTACVPALEIAKRRLRNDARSEPLVGERVPYVICYGTPGLPLIQLVQEPCDVLFERNLRINSVYYITKAIVPPLQRVFGLLGVNVMDWYNELPRDLRTCDMPTLGHSKHTISHYYHTKHCPFCDKVSENLCQCYFDQQKVGVLAHSQLSLLHHQYSSTLLICSDCTGIPHISANHDIPNDRNCFSLVCPVFYKKISLKNKIEERSKIRETVSNMYKW